MNKIEKKKRKKEGKKLWKALRRACEEIKKPFHLRKRVIHVDGTRDFDNIVMDMDTKENIYENPNGFEFPLSTNPLVEFHDPWPRKPFDREAPHIYEEELDTLPLPEKYEAEWWQQCWGQCAENMNRTEEEIKADLITRKIDYSQRLIDKVWNLAKIRCNYWVQALNATIAGDRRNAVLWSERLKWQTRSQLMTEWFQTLVISNAWE